MRVLIDTDAFCKLGLANLLTDAIGLFGARVDQCGRLPALPYMLRRGRIPKAYGQIALEPLIPLAEAMPSVAAGAGPLLDSLRRLPDVDPGEAIILSAAAEHRLPVISGDYRALAAVKDVSELTIPLHERVVVLEAVLLALCSRLGSQTVRNRVEPVRPHDTVVAVCFSTDAGEPEDGLNSYYRSRVMELTPLALWNPAGRGVT
jgi:hypothetical protein